jgi:hypothetical protein
MEEENSEITINGVAPPKSNFSTFFNSVTNYATALALPFIGAEVVREIGDKSKPNMLKKLSLAAGGAGCVVGAYYGVKEIRHLNDYRTALAGELDRLHRQVETTNQRLDSWESKAQASKDAPAEPAR